MISPYEHVFYEADAHPPPLETIFIQLCIHDPQNTTSNEKTFIQDYSINCEANGRNF